MAVSLPRKVLEKYITPGCVFIETGTRWGDTCIRAIEAGAKEAWTCEADKLIAGIAQLHCDDLCGERVHVKKLASVPFLRSSGLEVWTDHSNTVVFLDAHTESYSPVIEELNIIQEQWNTLPKAILIDDLRCMNGWGILVDRLQGKLLDMGYRVGYEDGVEPRDIMVGVMP